VPLARMQHGLLPAGGTSPSALPTRKFSELNTFKVGITHYPCTSQLSCLRIDASVTSHTARLDPGLAAHDYPGGIPTR